MYLPKLLVRLSSFGLCQTIPANISCGLQVGLIEIQVANQTLASAAYPVAATLLLLLGLRTRVVLVR